MKRYITYFIIAIATVLMATSCEKDVMNFHSSKEGGFSLDLKINNTELVTRALTDDQVKELAPTVNIYKPNFEGLIRSYIYGGTGDKKLPETIYLPAGEGYRVDVLAGEVSKTTPRKANFDTKSYQGSATFDIVAGPNNTTAVAVEAKIVNAITKVSFAESIAANFNDYTLTVALSEADLASEADANRKLVYNASNVASNTKSGEGYFIIDDIKEETSVYWNFQGTLKKDGSTFSASGNFAATTDSDNDEVMDLVAARQNMSFRYDVKDGTLKLGISHDTTIPEEKDPITWNPKSTGISTPKPYDIWATHLTLSADVDADQYTGAKFQYRVKNTTTPNAWSSSVIATKNTDGTYSATISGLSANTTYEFRLLCTPKATEGATTPADVVVGATDTNPDGDLKEIKTHTAPTIPNAGLENTSTGKDPTTGGEFPLFYGTGEEPWWDSGNAGSGGFGYTICYVATDDYKEGQKSARLESTWAAVKFAAGNLFSGRFGEVIGTSGGTVYFGRPFVGRPTAIRFWVKGAPAQVTDKGKGDHLSKGDYDTNQIKVALGTWTPGNGEGKYGGDKESPILINTTIKETFVDFNTDAATIAYGDLQITTNGTTNSATINGEASSETGWNGWKEVTLPLEYRDLKTLPTHIVISCAASMYGDYFEGSVNSKMWVDDFELIYDENVVTK